MLITPQNRLNYPNFNFHLSDKCKLSSNAKTVFVKVTSSIGFEWNDNYAAINWKNIKQISYVKRLRSRHWKVSHYKGSTYENTVFRHSSQRILLLQKYRKRINFGSVSNTCNYLNIIWKIRIQSPQIVARFVWLICWMKFCQPDS